MEEYLEENLKESPYDFQWEPENRLRFVEESLFQLAYRLHKEGGVILRKNLDYTTIMLDIVKLVHDIDVNDDYIQYMLEGVLKGAVDIGDIVSRKISTTEQAKMVFNGEELDSYHMVQYKGGRITEALETGVAGDVYVIAGYIQYLEETGQSHLIYQDRVWYRNNLEQVESSCETGSLDKNLYDKLTMFVADIDISSVMKPGQMGYAFYMASVEQLILAKWLQEKNYVSFQQDSTEFYDDMRKETYSGNRIVFVDMFQYDHNTDTERRPSENAVFQMKKPIFVVGEAYRKSLNMEIPEEELSHWVFPFSMKDDHDGLFDAPLLQTSTTEKDHLKIPFIIRLAGFMDFLVKNNSFSKEVDGRNELEIEVLLADEFNEREAFGEYCGDWDDFYDDRAADYLDDVYDDDYDDFYDMFLYKMCYFGDSEEAVVHSEGTEELDAELLDEQGEALDEAHFEEDALPVVQELTNDLEGMFVGPAQSHDFVKDVNSPVLDQIVSDLKDAETSFDQLFCVLQGDSGAWKQWVADGLATLMKTQDKVEDGTCLVESMKTLGTSIVATRSPFLTHRLIVLTDLDEFLLNHRNGKEEHKAYIAYMLHLLENPQPNTYVMILGEENQVEELFSMSPALAQVFGKQRICVERLPTNKLFQLYQTYLSPQLKENIPLVSTFEQKFANHILLNRSSYPMLDEKLAEHLAVFAKEKKLLVLPEDIYRKQTVKEQLQSVIGMENVKKQVDAFKAFALHQKRSQQAGLHLPHTNMHMMFTGNPGTGKTMIARIIGQALYELGLIKENKVIEVERKDLVSENIGGTALKTTSAIEEAMDGVLFIDEAYTLTPKSSRDFSSEAIATLITAMENNKENLVVIFAGYQKEMQSFLGINSGLASRISYTFHFEDYSTEELLDITNRKLKDMGYQYSPGEYQRVSAHIRDIYNHFQGRKNFGNGRFVDQLIQKMIMKQATAKVSDSNVNKLSTNVLPTLEEMVSTDVVETQDYTKQLDDFIGMETVKAKIHEFAHLAKHIKEARKAGATLSVGNMHMMFTGNPGTGKTTMARIMANMLYSIGIIRKNKVVEKERKDLIGEHIGQTAPKVNAAIEEAMDGVLFIDEAYTLTPKSSRDFGSEAIATLITAMENNKENLVVIFAGYRDEMIQFKQSNPGISSRIGNEFHFENYSVEALLKMYHKKVRKSGYTIGKDGQEAVNNQLTAVLTYFSKRKDFGNGRFVDQLFQGTILKHATQIKENRSNLLMLRETDIPTIDDLLNNPKEVALSTELEQIIGMNSLKAQMKDFEAMVNYQLKLSTLGVTLPDSNKHMLFTGNPGTGKTTVARIIAKKLFEIGVIMENKVKEVERKDLVAEYIGQTATKTGKVIDEAMGGVLFIDEAYTLTPSGNDFASEAIATLIKAMEDHKHDLVVIFAGYQKEMKCFLDSNAGIASRIGYTFDFEDYTAAELTDIYIKKAEHTGFMIEEGTPSALTQLMQYFCNLTNFGNGRFVDLVFQLTMGNRAKALREGIVITSEDIPSIQQMVAQSSQTGMVLPENITEESAKRTAIHEIGHAYITMCHFPEVEMGKITNQVEATGALGYVSLKNIGEYVNTKEAYCYLIRMYMGGIAAEAVFLGSYADGGSSDIEKAKNLISQMESRLGMSKYGIGGASTDEEKNREINEILMEEYDQATKEIEAEKEKIQKAVDLLLEKGEISQEKLKELFV